jgi:pyruvate dehydrogenase E1 component alpha subunit
MYVATKEAIENAKKGIPTLIEAITFRLGDHTTSDDASKYRTEKEVLEWDKKDPLFRVKKYFENIGTWSEDYGKWLEDQNKKEVNEAVEKALNIEKRKPEDLFEHIFKNMPLELQKQKKYLLEEVKND